MKAKRDCHDFLTHYLRKTWLLQDTNKYWKQLKMLPDLILIQCWKHWNTPRVDLHPVLEALKYSQIWSWSSVGSNEMLPDFFLIQCWKTEMLQDLILIQCWKHWNAPRFNLDPVLEAQKYFQIWSSFSVGSTEMLLDLILIQCWKR